MVNRRAFFEIFFYNRENRSREMMEAAEGVWRAYMKKHGLGLDAGNDGQPTYEEVKEITYLANAAIEMVEKQMAEAAAEEEKRKKLQKEAWDLGIFVPVDTATAELERLVLKAMNPQPEETAEETAEEVPEEAAEETVEEVVEEAAEETVEEAPAEVAEEVPAAVAEPVVQEVPVQVPPVEEKVVVEVPLPKAPAPQAAAAGDLGLWVEHTIRWCQSRGMTCIQTMDGGDCYLHVYLPYKKAVHPVGTWCFQENTGGAILAAEMTKLYSYCEGYADCFAKLLK